MNATSSLTAAACAALATISFAACGDNGDDGHQDPVDGAQGIDAASIDAPPPDVDAPPPDIDAPAPFVVPTPFAVPLSAAGPDQLQSAIGGPGGTFYAAGYAAQTVAGPRLVTVVQLSTTGPVPAFGQGGVATTALDHRGGSGEVNIALQSTGKLIVTATVASTANALDRDIAVVRLDADGSVDPTFGDGGVRILDISTGTDNGMGGLTGLDAARGVAVGAGDVIYVYGTSRADGTTGTGGPRTDTDYTVVKLGPSGARDMSFGGGDGKFTLDLQNTNATARGIKLLADGSLIGVGYANTPGLGSTQPVLFKLNPAGELVTAFGNGGVFHDIVLAVQTEAYNIAIHGNEIVTGGYGRDAGDQNDWISLRFDATTGARITSGWGPDGAGGKVLIDASGAMIGDNCRNVLALPGGKTALIGSTGPGNMPAQDAAVGVLTADGLLDTSYGDGLHTFALGANGNDQFWGGAVSGDHFIVVGYQGGGQAQTETTNDDAYGVMFEMR